MDASESVTADIDKGFLRTRIKKVVLAFFTILGVVFFCVAIFLSVYFVAYIPQKEPLIPTADGIGLYKEMKQIEVEKEKYESKNQANYKDSKGPKVRIKAAKMFGNRR